MTFAVEENSFIAVSALFSKQSPNKLLCLTGMRIKAFLYSDFKCGYAIERRNLLDCKLLEQISCMAVVILSLLSLSSLGRLSRTARRGHRAA